MFGNPETTTGGNALKFYSSVRLDVRRTAAIKQGDEFVGNRTRVKVVKNKLAPPFKEAEFDIVFGKGISKVGDILDLAVDNDVVKKSGSWFSFGDTRLGQGREAVKEFLESDSKTLAQIEQKLKVELGLADERAGASSKDKEVAPVATTSGKASGKEISASR